MNDNCIDARIEELEHLKSLHMDIENDFNSNKEHNIHRPEKKSKIALIVGIFMIVAFIYAIVTNWSC